MRACVREFSVFACVSTFRRFEALVDAFVCEVFYHLPLNERERIVMILIIQNQYRFRDQPTTRNHSCLQSCRLTASNRPCKSSDTPSSSSSLDVLDSLSSLSCFRVRFLRVFFLKLWAVSCFCFRAMLKGTSLWSIHAPSIDSLCGCSFRINKSYTDHQT